MDQHGPTNGFQMTQEDYLRVLEGDLKLKIILEVSFFSRKDDLERSWVVLGSFFLVF